MPGQSAWSLKTKPRPRCGAGGHAPGNEARDALLAYAWLGNIRELENVIHYALIICWDGRIAREDLQLHAVARPQFTPAAPAAEAADVEEMPLRVLGRLFDAAPQAAREPAHPGATSCRRMSPAASCRNMQTRKAWFVRHRLLRTLARPL